MLRRLIWGQSDHPRKPKDNPRTPLFTPQDTFIFYTYILIHFELEMRSWPR